MLNLSALNPQQRLAVETIQGPVLILAGAGTGKTRVITYRIAHMIAQGISPANILAVTFTNKAAREMQERVNKLVPRRKTVHLGDWGKAGELPAARADARPTDQQAHPTDEQRPTICTFHSLCVRILRQHIPKLGYKRNFVIYDEADQLSAVKKIMARISDKMEKYEVPQILAELSHVRSGTKGTVGSKENDMAAHIRPHYESALRACNAVDFDDLILLTLRLFAEHPDALEACRGKYKYVMVDEYQDTNGSQFDLVYALTREHRNFCVVGDDDQSIYGWRGAQIANLLEMEKDFPEVKVIKLEQNYRSTNTILSAANTVIKNNLQRRGKTLWSRKQGGEKITLHAFKEDEEEAREIVQDIESARIMRRVPWSANAILFRTNIQSRPLETALRKAGVRYKLIGGQSFFDRREIRDFLAYLKLFVNPNDEISLLRIANTPARGLSEATMEKLLGASHDRKCPVFEVMKNPAVTATLPGKTRQCVENFIELIGRTHKGLQEATSLRSWADRFLDEIGYYEELRRQEKTAEAAEARIRNIQDLVQDMDGSSTEASLGLTALQASRNIERLQTFLEEITLDDEREDEKEAVGDQVTLITMHSCKGLEFPHVYVVGLEEGLLPHVRTKNGSAKAEADLDEERRLFYVAITRAMESLTLSHCASRRKFGEAICCHPSRFLLDIPDELIQHGSEKGKELVTTEAGKNMFALMRDSIG